MSSTTDRPFPASLLFPHLLPAVLPLTSAPAPVALWERFRSLPQNPEMLRALTDGDGADIFERGMLIDDIAALFAGGTVTHENPLVGPIAWRTPLGPVPIPTTDPVVIDKLSFWVVEHAARNGRSVDQIEDFLLVRPVIADIVSERHRSVDTFYTLDDLDPTPPPAAPQSVDELRFLLARQTVLESLHYGLTATARNEAGVFAQLLGPDPKIKGMALSSRPHLATSELREFDAALCDAMVRTAQQSLELMGHVRVHVGLPYLELGWEPALVIPDAQARLGAMRSRFMRLPDDAHARLVAAFQAIPVSAHNREALRNFRALIANTPAEQRLVDPAPPNPLLKAMFGDAGLDTEAAITFDRDLASCAFGDAGLAYLPDAAKKDPEVSRSARPIYDELAAGDLAPLLAAASVGVEDSDRHVAEQLFATLAMPREEILLRMMSPEGSAIAQAIVFVSDVARDRLARGIDPTHDPNPVLE